MSSVGEEIQKEIKRVRDVVIPAYQEIGPPGQLAIMIMKTSLDNAVRALAEGDVIQIIRHYEDLKAYKL